MRRIKNTNGAAFFLLEQKGDYSLLVSESETDPAPYVVAWIFTENGSGECSWSQGHYFCDIINAVEAFRKYIGDNGNLDSKNETSETKLGDMYSLFYEVGDVTLCSQDGEVLAAHDGRNSIPEWFNDKPIVGIKTDELTVVMK